MDLKDITRGLRGGDESTGGDENTRADDGSRGATGSRSADGSDSPTDGSDEADEAAPDRIESPSDDAASGDADRDDDHVCPFCETEFDADRGACPDCDAEIVLRGTR